MPWKRDEQQRTCDEPECGRDHRAGGKCMGHWKQKQRGQELRPLRPRRTHMAECCGGTHYANNMCRRKYQGGRC